MINNPITLWCKNDNSSSNSYRFSNPINTQDGYLDPLRVLDGTLRHETIISITFELSDS